ncbi:MAG: hypothetical protein IIZ78_05785 [Clostridiales bacterium]|nr:hypothetical protein [Clostridiales bacterium]
MSKDYSAIDGIIKQTGECVTDAYNKGYKDGQVVTQQAFDATYEQGLEDAWEVAREVIRMDSTQQFEIFGEHGDINVLDLKSAKEAIKLYEEHKEKQKTVEQDRACPILDDNCPYPWLLCEDCEVHCVMERANRKLEERNGN